MSTRDWITGFLAATGNSHLAPTHVYLTAWVGLVQERGGAPDFLALHTRFGGDAQSLACLGLVEQYLSSTVRLSDAGHRLYQALRGRGLLYAALREARMLARCALEGEIDALSQIAMRHAAVEPAGAAR